MTPTALLLVGAALLTSMISGTLGMAGGIVLLGVMSSVMAPVDVVPVHGLVQLASNVTRTLAFLRQVHRPIFLVYAVPSALGIGLATLVWRGDQELGWFRPAIGVFLLAFLVYRRFSPKVRNLPVWAYAPLGVAIGFAGMFVGATGPLLAPFFLRDDFSPEQTIATKAACQFWLHLFKLPAFLAIGYDYRPHLPLVLAMVAAVVVGTLVGKRTLERLPPRVFSFVFQAVLAILAARLVLDAFL